MKRGMERLPRLNLADLRYARRAPFPSGQFYHLAVLPNVNWQAVSSAISDGSSNCLCECTNGAFFER